MPPQLPIAPWDERPGAALYQLPPHGEVGEGDLYFDVKHACGAPGGAKAWVKQVIEAARRPARFDPFDKLDELESHIGTGPGATLFFGYPRWAESICLLRYRFLASFFPKGRVKDRPPSDPALRRLWEKWRNAEKAAERAHERYREAATSLPFETTVEIKRGRRGNPVFRETMKGLTRLYSQMYGIPATHTRNGPAARFVSAFFDGLAEKWMWIDAHDFNDPDEHGRLLLVWTFLQPVQTPPASAIPDLLRAAIVEAPQQDALSRMELSRGVFGESRCPMPGAFVADQDGGEKWGTFDGKEAEFFRLVTDRRIP